MAGKTRYYVIEKIVIIIFFAVFLLFAYSNQALSIGSENYSMNSFVISSGGGISTSSNYQTNTILGTISGRTSSSNFSNYLGFFFGGGGANLINVNYPPKIDDISDIPSQTITEGSVSYVDFTVSASDQNGADDLNITALNASFSMSGEQTRINSTCTYIGNINSTAANFSCSIGIWYFDGAGTWNVSASIKDTKNNLSQPYSEQFGLASTTSMNLNGTSFSFSGVSAGSKNTTSDNNVTIYNIGNAPFSISVNASDLEGLTNPSYYIYAANFTVDDVIGCDGDRMLNDADIALTGVLVQKGNNSNNEGVSELFACLNEVSQSLVSQSYSTSGTHSWIVTIS